MDGLTTIATNESPKPMTIEDLESLIKKMKPMITRRELVDDKLKEAGLESWVNFDGTICLRAINEKGEAAINALRILRRQLNRIQRNSPQPARVVWSREMNGFKKFVIGKYFTLLTFIMASNFIGTILATLLKNPLIFLIGFFPFIAAVILGMVIAIPDIIQKVKKEWK